MKILSGQFPDIIIRISKSTTYCLLKLCFTILRVVKLAKSNLLFGSLFAIELSLHFSTQRRS